jgi:hypothetical protein
MEENKIRKALLALDAHRMGFPDKQWLLCYDRELNMLSVISKVWLRQLKPPYLEIISEKDLRNKIK